MQFSTETKLLGPFYLERFVSHLLYFLPAYWIIYFNQTLSLGQIGVIIGASYIGAFLFEIPTGAVADIYGRKVSTLLAYFLKSLLLPMFMFVHNYYILIALSALRGIIGTLNSGAREAWIVDNLKYYKKSQLIKVYFLKEHSLIKLGMFFSGILGTLVVAAFGLSYIWLFAGLSWFVSALFLVPVKEHPIKKKKDNKKLPVIYKQTYFQSILKQIKHSFEALFKNKTIMSLMIITFFFVLPSAFNSDVIWRPLLKNLGFPVYALGTLFSISMIIGSATAVVGKHIIKKFKSQSKYLIYTLIFQIIVSLPLLLLNNLYLIVAINLIMVFSIDLFKPIYSSFFQEFIPSRKRATLTSVNSMVWAVGNSIAIPLAGYAGHLIGLKPTIVGGALFLIPMIVLLRRLRLRRRVEKH